MGAGHGRELVAAPGAGAGMSYEETLERLADAPCENCLAAEWSREALHPEEDDE